MIRFSVRNSACLLTVVISVVYSNPDFASLFGGGDGWKTKDQEHANVGHDFGHGHGWTNLHATSHHDDSSFLSAKYVQWHGLGPKPKDKGSKKGRLGIFGHGGLLSSLGLGGVSDDEYYASSSGNNKGSSGSSGSGGGGGSGWGQQQQQQQPQMSMGWGQPKEVASQSGGWGQPMQMTTPSSGWGMPQPMAQPMGWAPPPPMEKGKGDKGDKGESSEEDESEESWEREEKEKKKKSKNKKNKKKKDKKNKNKKMKKNKKDKKSKKSKKSKKAEKPEKGWGQPMQMTMGWGQPMQMQQMGWGQPMQMQQMGWGSQQGGQSGSKGGAGMKGPAQQGSPISPAKGWSTGGHDTFKLHSSHNIPPQSDKHGHGGHMSINIPGKATYVQKLKPLFEIPKISFSSLTRGNGWKRSTAVFDDASVGFVHGTKAVAVHLKGSAPWNPVATKRKSD